MVIAERSGPSTSVSRSDVRVAPTTQADLPEIAACELLAFSGAFPPFNVFSRLLFPFRVSLARSGAHPRHWPDFASTIRKHVQNLRNGILLFTAFMQDEEGREVVVGMAKMTPPREVLEKARRSRRWKERVLGDIVYPAIDNVRMRLWNDVNGIDIGAVKIFKKEQEAVRDRNDKEREYFTLDLLFVHPSFQHRGVGSALLTQCTAIADAACAPLLLESSPAALSLYAAHSFVQVDALEFTYAGERVEMLCMVRQPVVTADVVETDAKVDAVASEGSESAPERAASDSENDEGGSEEDTVAGVSLAFSDAATPELKTDEKGAEKVDGVRGLKDKIK